MSYSRIGWQDRLRENAVHISVWQKRLIQYASSLTTFFGYQSCVKKEDVTRFMKEMSKMGNHQGLFPISVALCGKLTPYAPAKRFLANLFNEAAKQIDELYIDVHRKACGGYRPSDYTRAYTERECFILFHTIAKFDDNYRGMTYEEEDKAAELKVPLCDGPYWTHHGGPRDGEKRKIVNNG